jgi:hypothetical protein
MEGAPFPRYCTIARDEARQSFLSENLAHVSWSVQANKLRTHELAGISERDGAFKSTRPSPGWYGDIFDDRQIY